MCWVCGWSDPNAPTTAPFPALLDKAVSNSTSGCYRCGKNVLRTEELFRKCEQAGLVVDRSTGEVKARMGGFFMVGSMLDASSRLDTQRHTQHQTHEKLENQRGFRCKGCGRLYCMDCLFHHAPSHPSGGKACPKCGGTIEVFN